MESVAAVFGKRVKTLRKARGWTQEELARAARMDPKHIGAVERGTKTSSFFAVQRLAEVFDVKFYELFIPEHRSTELVDKEIADLTRNKGRIDVSNVQEFLRAMRSALRKLDRGPGTH